jgi:hypothetical protein
MDDKDRKKKAVLAEIAALPPGTSIEEWNKRRFTPGVIAQETAKLRASFIVPPKGRPH